MTDLTPPVARGQPAEGRRLWLPGPAIRTAALVFVAASGWAFAAYEKLVAEPAEVGQQRIAYTLEVVDRFGESPAPGVYRELSASLGPWWDEIRPIQLKIMETKDEREKEALIDQRDSSLLRFIRDHQLEARVDMLVAAFERFNRCLLNATCNEDVVRKAVAIDVKRIYRTFRPYIIAVRQRDGTTSTFGRDIEDLFFRFLYDSAAS